MAITVWLADLGAAASGPRSERAAACGVVAEQLLRHGAVTGFGVAASTVRVERPRHAPPIVALAARREVFASLSHSGRWVAAAVHAEPLGLDIEAPSRRRNVLSMSEWFFAPQEHEWLRRHADPEEAFYRLWTGKEAVLKLGGAQGRETSLAAVRFRVFEEVLLPPEGTSVRYDALTAFDASLRCSVALLSAGAPGEIRFERADGTHLPSLRAKG